MFNTRFSSRNAFPCRSHHDGYATLAEKKDHSYLLKNRVRNNPCFNSIQSHLKILYLYQQTVGTNWNLHEDFGGVSE